MMVRYCYDRICKKNVAKLIKSYLLNISLFILKISFTKQVDIKFYFLLQVFGKRELKVKGKIYVYLTDGHYLDI